MDLAVLDSARSAAAYVLKTVPRIDAVICNAAIAQVPSQRLTVDGFEKSSGRISLGYKMGIRTVQFDNMNWDKNYHQNKTNSKQTGADDVRL